MRQINIVIDGVAQRLRREHNDLAWAVWHTAYLTAYAPEKPKKFMKLKALLHDAPQASTAKSWRQDFDAFAAWARAAQTKG